MEKFRKKLAGEEHFNARDYKDLLGKEFQLSSKTVSLEAYEDNPYRNPQHISSRGTGGYELQPLKEWGNTTKPYQPVWWDAFTALRHDRLTSPHMATLGNAINALAATYILLTFRREKVFKGGRVDYELYNLFVPKYWTVFGYVGRTPMWK